MVPFYGCDPVNKVFPPLNSEVPLSKGEGMNSVSLIYTCQKKREQKNGLKSFLEGYLKMNAAIFWVTHGNLVLELD